ncbi:MAG: class I SAM-dependent methyltransferase [Planctomycetota bacterium]|jgi:predicted methyltransferase
MLQRHFRSTIPARSLACLAALPLLVLGCRQVDPAPAAPLEEASVKPGINEGYLDPEMDIDAMVRRFEVESREIAAQRDDIVVAIEARPGDRLADIGAGTGLFLEPLAAAVGAEGRLYAVDIAAPFVGFLSQRAAKLGLTQVEPRLCSERSVDLPADSIDVAFVCDVYHHFEYPMSSLASIHSALSPGGRLVIVDFERIPGVTREWILNHVRAGKDEVIAEVEAAGFRLLGEKQVTGLSENYFIVFERP